MLTVAGSCVRAADEPALGLRQRVAKHRRTAIPILLVCTTAALALRWVWLVNTFASDLLFWDQWDLWDVVFRPTDAWTAWRFQFGPQRQGLANWLLAGIVWAFDWNPRAESLGAAVIVILAAGMGLATVRSLRGRWAASDCLVPLTLLTVSLVAVATVVPNLAHGPMPFLLVMTCAFFAQAKHERTRVFGVAVTLALSIQTGFTWLMAVVVLPLQIVLLVGAVRAGRPIRDHVVGLALVVASLAVFFFGFRFEPAVACFHFPDPKPWRYFVFMTHMMRRMTELPWLWVGVAATLLGVGLAAWSGWTTLATAGRDRLAASVLVLSGFSLTFAANTAVGRLCLGYDAGGAGRYIPYTLPLVMAIYLFVALWPRLGRLRPVPLIALLAFLAAKETVRVHDALVEARHFARVKTAFRSCYLATPDVAACSARWAIHPDHRAARIQQKLDYLRDRRLGLFRKAAR